VQVTQIADGLWRWTARHPDWTPEEGESGWEPDVGCVYAETDEGIVLVDPLVPSAGDDRDRFWRALDRDVDRAGSPPAVLLTVYWHTRSAADVLDRYAGARVFAPETRRDEFRKRTTVTDWFGSDSQLPGRAQSFATAYRGEVVYFLPGHAALVPGDVLHGHGDSLSLCPDDWLEDGVTREQIIVSLRPLLRLRVERVLTSHGEPVLAGGAAALAAALG
jgi:glyoxylase-like metal-dependent hydrolase (beta-lactamase superfamily II)